MLRGASIVIIASMVSLPVQAADYWYYCDSARGYYPYVQSCPEQRRPVVPNSDPYGEQRRAAPALQAPVRAVAPPISITPPPDAALVPSRIAPSATAPAPQQVAPQPTDIESEDAGQSETHDEQPATEPVVQRTTPKPEEAQPAPLVDSRQPPRTELALIAAVQDARQQYSTGANDMAKGAARPMRAKATCQNLGSLAANNWVGHIATLSSNGDGKGVLEIDIGNDVEIKTWNNALSDTFDHTLIEPDSPVFSAASQLKEGELVQFSGSFIPSSTDCIEEGSVTLGGSIDKPEYLFRFRSITPL